MKILLDTCAFLWLSNNDSRLSKRARELFENKNNQIYLSSISSWKIEMKYAIGRLSLAQHPSIFVLEKRKAMDISPLSFDEGSALQYSKLPSIHRDPFDRMLVAQAIKHGLTILTCDRDIQLYPINTEW